MAITTMDGLVAALGEAQDQKLYFPSSTTVNAGWLNLNQAAVTGFGQMAVPTARASGGTTYNQSSFSTGFPLWTDGAVGETAYIGRYGLTGTATCSVHVYDLMYAASNFSGNSTAAQTITGFTGMPTRNTNGVNCEIWIGCSAAIGATGFNITVQYTNELGTSGRNTISTAGITSMPANRMMQVALQDGDKGVQSIQSMTLSAASGTAGNMWVMVLERLCSIALPTVNVGSSLDFATLGLPKIYDESCLLFVHQGTGTATGLMMGQLDIIHG